jgi:hypothetical protein
MPTMSNDNRPAWLRTPWVVGLAVVALLVVLVHWLVRWEPAAPPSATPALETPAPSPAPAEALPQVASSASMPVVHGASPASDAEDVAEEVPADMPPLEGIHVFPPLGTKQLLSGIIVPEDFELPPGYVRHFQTTDDGDSLPPILMFHPRNPPLDSRGEPLPVTPDRIVPPELAPEGMPIVILQAPRSGPPRDGLSRFFDSR